MPGVGGSRRLGCAVGAKNLGRAEAYLRGDAWVKLWSGAKARGRAPTGDTAGAPCSKTARWTNHEAGALNQ